MHQNLPDRSDQGRLRRAEVPSIVGVATEFRGLRRAAEVSWQLAVGSWQLAVGGHQVTRRPLARRFSGADLTGQKQREQQDTTSKLPTANCQLPTLSHSPFSSS